MNHLLPTATGATNQSIRQAVYLLAFSPRHKSLHSFTEALSLFSHSQYRSQPSCPDPEIVAWDIVAMWVTGVVTRNLSLRAKLTEASEWFFAGHKHDPLTDFFPSQDLREAEKTLHHGVSTAVCHELLPYVLDPHGPGSRQSVMRDPSTGPARARKRADGVFYTPADVADYMVRECLDSLHSENIPTVYDPACGTGVFLRAALRELRKRHSDKNVSLLAFECLFGTDIAPWPLDATAFVLLAELLVDKANQETTPVELWSRLRKNLGCIDTLLVGPAHSRNVGHHKTFNVSLTSLFPAIKDGPTVIVGNPPYTSLGEPPYFKDLVQEFKTLQAKPRPTAEVYVAFLEQMLRLGNRKQCAASLVLPLSIASNIGPQFIAARQLIQNTKGHWRFAFFDRQPQALFGEDVKTRNAIIFWNRDAFATEPVLASGPLRRWRTQDRASIFDTIQFTRIRCDIRGGIPKIEGGRQASALGNLSARWHRLGQAVSGVKRLSLANTIEADDHIVFVGTTAYNFLNVFLRPPKTTLEGMTDLSENKLHAIHCTTPKTAQAVLGILTSHLAYWWWHTYGDGFHVLKRFILSFPFGNDVLDDDPLEFLSRTGAKLWSVMNTNPTISLNRGRLSVAYNPNCHTDIRRSIDRVLVEVAGLSDGFVDELQQFTAHTVEVASPQPKADRKIMN